MLLAQKEQLVNWLNDAHAMERSLEKILEDHVKHLAAFPDLRDRLEEHLLATRRHATRLVEGIHALGGQVSEARTLLANTMARIEGKSTAIFKDKIVKDLLADYAAEQFEVGCYTALIAGAEEFGEPHVAELCRKNLHEDEAMAAWLHEQIPVITRQYLMQGTLVS